MKAAEKKNDEDLIRELGHGQNCVAREAHYHRSCRTSYVQCLYQPHREAKKCVGWVGVVLFLDYR